MGLGIALGGATKGIESAEQAKLGQDQLQLGRDQMVSNERLAQQRLGLEAQRVQLAQSAQAQGQLDQLTKMGVESAKMVLESGGTPEAKAAALKQIFEPIIEVNPNAEKVYSQLKAVVGMGTPTATPIEPVSGSDGGPDNTVTGLAQAAGVNLPPPVMDTGELKTHAQKQLFELNNKVQLTSQMLDELSIFKDLVMAGETGKVTAMTMPMRQFFKEAGIIVGDNIPVQEAIQAAQNQLALRLRNPESGFGLTGSTSDRDVQFLKDAVGGLQNSPEGNKAAVIIQIAKARREADLTALRANLAARKASHLFEPLKKAYIERVQMFTPEEKDFLGSLKGGGSQSRGNQVLDFSSLPE